MAADSLAAMDADVMAVSAATAAAGSSYFCSSAATALAETTADAAVDVDANKLKGMSAYAASPFCLP